MKTFERIENLLYLAAIAGIIAFFLVNSTPNKKQNASEKTSSTQEYRSVSSTSEPQLN